MKTSWFTVLGLSATLALSATAADESPLKSQKEKISYMLGMNVGKQLKQSEYEIDYDTYLKGLKDAMSDGKMLLSEEDARQLYTSFRQEMSNKQMEKRKVEGEKSKKEGEAFLAENKKKEGIKVTASGLQYQVITEGKGKVPTSNDTVVTHYRGSLINDTEFDSSYKRGEPATFGVTQVIKGWTEALTMMPVGSKWKLFIPSELAYGERGQGPKIPANATLIFDIELLSIKEPEADAKK